MKVLLSLCYLVSSASFGSPALAQAKKSVKGGAVDNRAIETYESKGPFRYSHLRLVLFADNTYAYDAWQHLSSQCHDAGTWRRVGDTLVLASARRTRCRAGDPKKYQFVDARFKQEGNVLRLHRKDDKYGLYREYFTLVRQQ